MKHFIAFVALFVVVHSAMIGLIPENVRGNTGFSGWLHPTHTTSQDVFADEVLTALTPGSKIVGVRLRRCVTTDEEGVSCTATNPGWDFDDFVIVMGSSVHPVNATTIFDDNYTVEPTTVFNSSLSIASGSFPYDTDGTTPCSFGTTFSFSTPYTYEGGHLAIYQTHSANGLDNTTVVGLDGSWIETNYTLIRTIYNMTWDDIEAPEGIFLGNLTNGTGGIGTVACDLVLSAGGGGDPHFSGFNGESLDITHDAASIDRVFVLYCDKYITVTTLFSADPNELLFMSHIYVNINGFKFTVGIKDNFKVRFEDKNPGVYDAASNQTTWKFPDSRVDFKFNNQKVRVESNNVFFTIQEAIMETTPYLNLGLYAFHTANTDAKGLLGRTLGHYVAPEEFQNYQPFKLSLKEDKFNPNICF